MRQGGVLPRLGRRGVLRAGAGLAAGLLLGGGAPAPRPAAAWQGGSFTPGGRWIEATGYGLAQDSDPSQFIAFATEFPVYAVAPSWGGEGDPGGTVELLWSGDGVTWSEPITIGRSWHGGRPDRDGRNIGNLVSLPGASFLQYRTYDAAGNFSRLPAFELDYFDPTPGPALEQVANPATTPAFSPPPVISRAGWGADESLRFAPDGREIFPVEYQPVERVIIHHADTANFNDPVLEMRSIYYFHAITRGWGDIAYNYLIDFMGNVYEGRVGGENAVGCHAEGYNAGSCGICLMGRFFDNGATPEMHAGAVWAASWAARNLDPASAGPFHDLGNLPTICGHRDVNNTSCPGEEFYQQLEAIRVEARRVVRGRDDPEPPPAEWLAGMRVITTEDAIALREGPGEEFAETSTIPLGERLGILDGPTTNEGVIWYYVEGVSSWGWIAGNLLAVDPNPEPPPTPVPTPLPAPTEPAATPLPEEAAPPDPAAEPAPPEAPAEDAAGGDGGRKDKEGKAQRQDVWSLPLGAPATVAGGPVNLYVEPGPWATILTALPDGYSATILAGPVDVEGVAWYQVVTPENVDGWCDGSFLLLP